MKKTSRASGGPFGLFPACAGAAATAAGRMGDCAPMFNRGYAGSAGPGENRSPPRRR